LTAKDHGHEQGSPVAQGMRFDGLTGPQRERILAEAFDYRGDVTLRLDDGSSVTGYVFAVEAGREPHLKMFPADAASDRLRIPLASIVGCEFSGRDTADGRSWEAWVKRWEEKRRLLAEGVDVGDIEPKPEEL
jgi:hypothetical protein